MLDNSAKQQMGFEFLEDDSWPQINRGDAVVGWLDLQVGELSDHIKITINLYSRTDRGCRICFRPGFTAHVKTIRLQKNIPIGFVQQLKHGEQLVITGRHSSGPLSFLIGDDKLGLQFLISPVSEVKLEGIWQSDAFAVQYVRFRSTQFLFSDRRNGLRPVALEHHVSNASIRLITVMEQTKRTVVRNGDVRFVDHGLVEPQSDHITGDLDRHLIPFPGFQRQRFDRDSISCSRSIQRIKTRFFPNSIGDVMCCDA